GCDIGLDRQRHSAWQVYHETWKKQHAEWEQRYAEWERTPAQEFSENALKSSIDGQLRVVSSKPLPPEEPTEVLSEPSIDTWLYWGIFAVPAGFYALLRTIAWILRGFSNVETRA